MVFIRGIKIIKNSKRLKPALMTLAIECGLAPLGL